MAHSAASTVDGAPIAFKSKAKKSVTFVFSHPTTTSPVASRTTLAETNTELATFVPNLTIGGGRSAALSNLSMALDLCENLRKVQQQAAVDT